MPGYRDTLNLPKTEFPMKADLVRREPERLAWWRERDLYGALRARRAGAPVFLLHDGPPYSNGHLHMGTAANKIWKDAAIRQAGLMGFDSPYVPGWDNHGMPIEIQVGKEFRQKGEQPDALTLRRRCREYAHEWVAIQRAEFERLGVWGTWDDPYLTMAPRFEAEILRTFARLAERGFVQRGLRSIHWCPTDRTALAVAEIEYQDDPSPSIHVAFPLRRDPNGALKGLGAVSAVAWTTTPWTLPANLGLMVDPSADYVVAETAGRRFLVAEPRLAAVSAAADWDTPRVLSRVKGAALVDAVFEGPWGNDSRVVDGTPYVSMEDGTGLVHTAPGHGQEDFIVGLRAGLLPASLDHRGSASSGAVLSRICPVDEAGRFTAEAEHFVGRNVLEVNGDIIAWLRDNGRLLASSTFTHSYPHCWRCRQPVIFRATEQWFMIIDHEGHRDRALASIERDVRWDPASSQNRIRESVRGRPDWCLSRQRAWGVGIPAVYCQNCGKEHLDPRIIENVARETGVAQRGSDVWFERPVRDFLPSGFQCSACGDPEPSHFRKETDILDVWFDSGSTHRAVQVTHPALKPLWERALAGGGRVLYLEGPDQHRGWFNSSLMVGVGTADRAPYTDVATHGWVLDAQGRAMHKSLGNVISPEDIVKRHGAEIVRWWALATDWRNDVRVGDEILQRVSEAYRKVRNTFRFLLGNLSDFGPADVLPDERLTPVDRAFVRHLRARIERMRESWESLQFHRALDALLDVCTVDLSGVFLDFSKDRLYTLAAGDPARRSAQTVLWEALRGLAIAASPALVFTAEETWQHHPGLLAEQPSVHLADWPRTGASARDEEEWESLQGLRDAVNAAIEPLRASKVMNETKEAEVTVTAPAAALERLGPYAPGLADLLMVASVTLLEGAVPEGASYAVAVTRTAHPKCERCWNHRADVAAEGGLCGRCTAVVAG
jgi:isoleucyl-tRNA synthetase